MEPSDLESLERIKNKYTELNKQLSQQRAEIERVTLDKENIDRSIMAYSEISKTMLTDLRKTEELNKRLQEFILQTLAPLLPQEHQTSCISALETCKTASPRENGAALHPGMLGIFQNMQFNMHPAAMSQFFNQFASPQVNGGEGAAAKSSVEGNGAKKPKLEEPDDGELEIDVTNDDNPSTTSNGAANKNGRDSASSGASTSSNASNSAKVRQQQQQHLPPGGLQSLEQMSILAGFNPNMFRQAGGFGLLSDSHAQARLVAAFSFKIVDGGVPTPTTFPPDAQTGPGIPTGLKKKMELNHEEVVCAAAIARDNARVYTCGKGCVKIWDVKESDITGTNVVSRAPISSLDCFEENYIRSCKLFKDGNTLLIGGEASTVALWDLTTQTKTLDLETDTDACYAVGMSLDEKLLFACLDDGNILIYDIRGKVKIVTLSGHNGGASCLDFSKDGTKRIMGGWFYNNRSGRRRKAGALAEATATILQIVTYISAQVLFT